MKDFKLLLLGTVLSVGLIACGDEADEVNNAESEDDNSTVENNDGNDTNKEAEEGTSGIDEDLFITVATGGTSGVYYPIGGAIAKVLESDLGLDTSVQSTGASVENINLLDTNRTELAITMADAVSQAYEGNGAFEGEEPKENLTGLAALYPNFVQVVTTADTGIETIDDLEGKSIGVGAPGSGVELNARLVLEAHDMSYDDIEEDFLSYSEAIDQIKNGQIDAAFVTSGVPNATIIDLSTTHDAIVIPIEGKPLESLIEEYPFFSTGVIEGGTYDQEGDVNTATITNLLLVNSKLSDDTVYEITKSLFENIDDIHASHNAAQDIILDNIEEGMPIPFHPGAQRYFEEVDAFD
ncbi:C4-dicarboxylate ABC transporter substrate-binding protein [Salipaludibacillus neizhouensis]|uniref:C4-dicarboxylate ABC transporter substrate-binding protein n=1 Tax=Salipaludibacillus neizhouensis TaxID=885475 RepID=A0A3A9K406_9BACI|nr:TAXI family TRAP transporter solute-binding subunit [Salipaludibacillus neizhouensis]RKL67069.1 C4-dicarboxylate ABC transporter substrate-binding protein [Salipaludibacillus neizhouensis]